jgi:hypothetical protein
VKGRPTAPDRARTGGSSHLPSALIRSGGEATSEATALSKCVARGS